MLSISNALRLTRYDSAERAANGYLIQTCGKRGHNSNFLEGQQLDHNSNTTFHEEARK